MKASGTGTSASAVPTGDKMIVPLEVVTKADHALAGGKATGLGDLFKTGIPIPPGYVITTQVYDAFIQTTGIAKQIDIELSTLDPGNTERAESVSAKIRDLFEQTPFPEELKRIILEAHRAFVAKNKVEFSAVRSSATAEDMVDASFAGLQETFLNVKSPEEILHSVKKCWSSLFTPRVIVYRERKGYEHASVKLAVLVQKMVNSDVSGILFTADPNTGEKRLIIEAGWGLGELIVGGEVTPDHYVVDPATSHINIRKLSTQKVKLVKKQDGGSVRVEVPAADQALPKLDDAKLMKLASLARVIESHYRRAMDVEWCLEGSNFYIVQARPITTSGQAAKPSSGTTLSKILVRGLGASPGTASGTVRMLAGAAELSRMQSGEILVTTMTTPDMVPAMSLAAGIVTDEGGMTCHAAIVSRELGVPCIVGTREATKTLKEGQVVNLDGKLGIVYEGGLAEKKPEKSSGSEAHSGKAVHHFHPVTTTKVYVNVSIPEKAEEYAALPVQGVGLFRIEFIFASYVKTHPLALIREGKGKEMVQKLADGIEKVCAAFNPRPVIIRTSDFKTNEYRGMPGGADFEPEESNPMIGWRGCSRYVSPAYREAFLLELDAIHKVRTERGLKNAHIMLPFVRNTEELELIARMMEDKGLRRTRDLKLYLMAEVPSTVFLAKEFSQYCDGFSIGSNDLTQLVLGADRDSDILGKMGYFDERDPAVKRAIEMLISGAHEMGRTVGICGQAPSVYPEIAEFLVEKGIDSISLNADTVIPTIRTIAAAEQKILLGRTRA